MSWSFAMDGLAFVGRKSLTWVMQQDIVDAVVVGVKSKEEIDEAIKHINDAFAEKA